MAKFDTSNLIKKFRTGIDAALGVSPAGEKLERLLTLRNEVKTEFANLASQGKGQRAGLVAAMLAGAAIFSFAVALAGHIAIPALVLMVASGGSTFISAIALHWKSETARDRVGCDADLLVAKINREVLDTATAHPQEAMQSKKFQQALTGEFNTFAMVNEVYASQGRRLNMPSAALQLAG
jgi:hypothetical protein